MCQAKRMSMFFVSLIMIWSLKLQAQEPNQSSRNIHSGISQDQNMIIALPVMPTNLEPFEQSPGLKYLQEGNYKAYVEELEKIVMDNPSDDEIAVFVYNNLGYTWDKLARQESSKAYSQKAKEYFEKARDIATKNEDKYRLHLAHIYHGVVGVYEYLGEYAEALETYKMIARDCAGVGTGKTVNTFAAMGISNVVRFSSILNVSPAEVRSYLLDIVSQRQEGEVVFSAMEELVKLHVMTKDVASAKGALESLKNRYRGTESIGQISIPSRFEHLAKMVDHISK